MEILLFIRKWSEFWAFFAPLTIIFIYRKKFTAPYKPLVWYIYTGIILNAASTTMYAFHEYLTDLFYNNNILYNLHSAFRVGLFSLFLSRTGMFRRFRVFRVTLWTYVLFVLVLFLFFLSPMHFCTPLFIAETVVLIILCTYYFYCAILDDEVHWTRHPSFLLTAALFLFEAVNFFVFLFYTPVGRNLTPEQRRLFWTIHDFSLVAFCAVIAIVLYRSTRPPKQHYE